MRPDGVVVTSSNVHLRWCPFCTRWELDTHAPTGWMEARRARGFGRTQVLDAVRVYSSGPAQVAA